MGPSSIWSPRNVIAPFCLIASIERLHEDLVKLYSAQLVSVMEYIQSKKVMHRDLKPQNILLDDNYNIKVV